MRLDCQKVRLTQWDNYTEISKSQVGADRDRQIKTVNPNRDQLYPIGQMGSMVSMNRA